MSRTGSIIVVLFVFTVCYASANESTNLLPNPSFEKPFKDNTRPLEWKIDGGPGIWENEGRTDKHSVSVIGTGDNASQWRCKNIQLDSNKVYLVEFYAKGYNSDGTIVSGISSVNRDYSPTNEWVRHSFAFQPPKGEKKSLLRFGQWHCTGKVSFDDVKLIEVTPIHNTKDYLILGADEKIENNIYTFRPDFSGDSSNYSRCLDEMEGRFNSPRWVLNPVESVIFKHTIGLNTQLSGQITININYSKSSTCVVRCSKEKKYWYKVGEIDGTGSKTLDLPEELFPAKTVYIMISCKKGNVVEAGTGSLQFNDYCYTSNLKDEQSDMTGSTHFIETHKTNEAIHVRLTNLEAMLPGEGKNLHVAYRSYVGIDAEPNIIATIEDEAGKITPLAEKNIKVDAFKKGQVAIPYQIYKPGKFTLHVKMNIMGNTVYAASAPFEVPALEDQSYGCMIDENKDSQLWWCEGTYKINRTRSMPDKNTAKPPKISAARGEYEPIQIVIKPKRDIENVKLSVTADDTKLADAFQIHTVAYHYVKKVSDSSGTAGYWPDALPPYSRPLNLKANLNQPIWLQVKVPENYPAGNHKLQLNIEGDGMNTITVPVTLKVYDFSLPKETRLKSAIRLEPIPIRQYHNLETLEEQRQVWDLYMQNYREHRISPQEFAPFDPIEVEFTQTNAEVDFSAWDKQAKKYLTEYGFNAFRLIPKAIGHGSFHSQSKGGIGEFEQGSEQYRKLFKSYLMQLQNHLEENGWLDKIYAYWFDEPTEKDYEFVKAGMEEIKLASPKIQRLLTQEPTEELYGDIDIWCPILHTHDAQNCQARQKLGEKVWWYVCTGPKAPYPGLFIDHGATDLRVWLWMSWKWNVEGLLVWSSNYWTSNCAYPKPTMQNPWQDPMSYVTDYGYGPGYVGYWGNGDGRFLYPPNRTNDDKKYIEGPVNSIRWEMIREGIEDYEYFYLLKNLIAQAKEAGINESLTKNAETLLEIPQNIITNKRSFTRDPQPMFAHREKIADAIEQLSKSIKEEKK